MQGCKPKKKYAENLPDLDTMIAEEGSLELEQTTLLAMGSFVGISYGLICKVKLFNFAFLGFSLFWRVLVSPLALSLYHKSVSVFT